ncbi:hypothetical protein [Staphylococcus carnosus]|uniref:Lipoprotein n=2 Tax=Staphylococcus carnosus TaxID=1281 RepID=B9DLK1_STACT|nr:hypothetical protein [Staphylococcus carnosus]QPT03190.1 hypothetical protein I6G40_08740 [Staphylococcus carnosus]UQA68193.1 hypothetical protein Sta3580_04770 [Staphylococcus carnosus]UTB79245.1 hypothetical protein A2I62_12115 [Staphylococcus carnosus]UTB88797.1 hypothetical protein A2I63_12115 [Staphylococcus carnosus]UTB91146.1 hypothetical protein A2I64_12110 [Staphylococcus carnosus]
MKKAFIILFACILIPALTGCEKDFKDKKEVSIKDIINDEHEHVIWATGGGGEDAGYVSQIIFTKNGKVKSVPIDQSAEVPTSFIESHTPSELEDKMKKDGPPEYKESKWQEPAYIVIENSEEKPLVTMVINNKKGMKDHDKKSVDRVMEDLGNTEAHVMYSETSSGGTQYPTDKPKTYGTFTFDPSIIIGNDDAERTISFTTLLEKGQKLVQLSKDDLKNDDHVYNFSRSELEN